ncbi:unnamed protein product [Rhizopus stolonifer]
MSLNNLDYTDLTFKKAKTMNFDNMQKIREALKVCAKNEGFAIYTIRSFRGKGLYLGCRHYGTPRKHSVPEATIVDEEGNVLQTITTKKFIPRKKNSQRSKCSFKIYCQSTQNAAGINCDWTITYVKGEHNHPIARNPFSCPMNRRVKPEVQRKIVQLVKSGAKSSSASMLRQKTLLTSDGPENAMHDLIMQLQDDGYIVHYSTMALTDNKKMLFKVCFLRA